MNELEVISIAGIVGLAIISALKYLFRRRLRRRRIAKHQLTGVGIAGIAYLLWKARGERQEEIDGQGPESEKV